MYSHGSSTLLPDVVLLGYRNGFFPMADPDTGRIVWHRPDQRAIIPLDKVHLSRSLRATIRRETYTTTVNMAFADVITACADREDTWISSEVVEAYEQLHHLGHAHSIESWHKGQLVGGLYGVAIGGAFFGESMFSWMNDASKVAFATLTRILHHRGFRLLDTQYINDFTESLGAVEIPDLVYQMLLADALLAPCSFNDA
jgi:leucyl/phenylalanyl-tRNA---protein transferase